jgi:hypothetical protein
MSARLNSAKSAGIASLSAPELRLTDAAVALKWIGEGGVGREWIADSVGSSSLPADHSTSSISSSRSMLCAQLRGWSEASRSRYDSKRNQQLQRRKCMRAPAPPRTGGDTDPLPPAPSPTVQPLSSFASALAKRQPQQASVTAVKFCANIRSVRRV